MISKIKKDKRGKGGTAAITTLLTILTIAIVGGVVYMIFFSEPAAAPSVSGGINTPTTCADSTAKLTVNPVNALNKGSSVTATTVAGVNDASVSTSVTSGTTEFPVGSKVTILVSNTSDYIDVGYTIDSIDCGGEVVEIPMYLATSDNPLIRIRDQSTNQVLTDTSTGGAVNHSNIAVGTTTTFDVEFTGTALESSGKGLWILEFPAGSAVNISKVTLDGAEPVSIPNGLHASVNAASEMVAFEIEPVVGGVKKTMSLAVELTSTGDLTGGVLTDWYAYQDFVDSDGTIKNGAVNKDGVVKYENTLDYDIFIASA